MDALKETVVRLAVRTRRTLGADGSCPPSRWVFCRSRGRSVNLSVCEACPHVRALPDARGERLECVGMAPTKIAPRADVAEAAARAVVADVVGPESLCVSADAPVALLGRRAPVTTGWLPVVSKDGRLQGVLDADVAPLAGRQIAGELAAAPPAVLVDAMPLSVAIECLAEAPRGALPVVSETGFVVGTLTSHDVVRWLAQQIGYAGQADRRRAPSPQAQP
jgi:CBS domain-containing protein